MGKKINLLGETFGHLTVVAETSVPYKNTTRIRWVCRCVCGATRELPSDALKSGRNKSCGCMRGLKHGTLRSGAEPTPTYNTWIHMRARCNNPSNDSYYLYGARGISVCPRWDSFATFLSDMGERPEGHTIDRIDTNGNYNPENCRWASAQEQAMNRRTDHAVSVRTGKIAASGRQRNSLGRFL